MKLLVTGGAGYIGSHMVKCAQEQGHEVVVLDDFSTGNAWAVKECEILDVDLVDQDKLAKSLRGRFFDGVIHFASKSLVEESILDPGSYYINNFTGTLNLVKEMIANDISNLVFSSTAAIFGDPKTEKISENHPKNPINPYGKSKLLVELMLEDMSKAYDLNIIALRYFNASGAHDSGEIGEFRDHETHLIPNILRSLFSNHGKIEVYGDDYSTHDGTCIRDYVHVVDLINAHLLGLTYMKKIKGFSTFNLGNGNGFSVLEVIKCIEKILGESINYVIKPRRNGDPSVLVANSLEAINKLGWKPNCGSMENIIKSAFNFYEKRNQIRI